MTHTFTKGPATIYAVNSGSYSDYRVVALFSSEKMARELLVKDNDEVKE